jgi:hypothetical protein
VTRRQIKPTDVASLQKYDSRKFADWISQGFLAYEQGNMDAVPFGEAFAFLGEYEDISDDVAAIYSVLIPSAQAAFRRGLAVTIAELNLNTDVAILAAVRILETGGKVGAVELLDVLNVAVLSKDFLKSTKYGATLWTIAASLALELAVQDDRAYDCLVNLVLSPNFSSEYASKALVSFCRAKPDRLDDSLQILNVQLRRQIIGTENDVAGRMDLFRDVAKLVHPDKVLTTLEKFSLPGSGLEALKWWSDIPFLRSDDADIDGWMQDYREALSELAKFKERNGNDEITVHEDADPDAAWSHFGGALDQLDEYGTLDETTRVQQFERLKSEANSSASTLEEFIDESEAA